MGLLELVKHDRDMRKLFGERELKIIEKQLLGINLSPSEKTRLSRDIRPKFKIISKLANHREEFDLKKAQEIKFLIDNAREIILNEKNFPRVEKIYVFGSYVENSLRLDSDVDIAVVFKNISPRDASKFKISVTGKLNKRVQLSVFNVLPKKIKDKILKEGRIIYQHGKS